MYHFAFAFVAFLLSRVIPSSTRRLIASERFGTSSCWPRQRSTALRNSTGNRTSNRAVLLQSQSSASDDFFRATVLNSLADIPMFAGHRMQCTVSYRNTGTTATLPRWPGLKADNERITTTAGAEGNQ
jgi:hypothetical protein